MTTQVGTIEATVPVDASTLAERCWVTQAGLRCRAQAAWRVLGRCPGCPRCAPYAACTPHKDDALTGDTVTVCCDARAAVIAVETL